MFFHVFHLSFLRQKGEDSSKNIWTAVWSNLDQMLL